MLIALASDAHGHRDHVEQMLLALPAIDMLCFLGDCDADAQRIEYGLREAQPDAQFHAVAGNANPFSRLSATEILRLHKTRALITHGHLFHVKQGRDLLAEAARQHECALAFYGHTHIQRKEALCGALLINPGALFDGRYAIVRVGSDGEVEVEMCEV